MWLSGEAYKESFVELINEHNRLALAFAYHEQSLTENSITVVLNFKFGYIKMFSRACAVNILEGSIRTVSKKINLSEQDYHDAIVALDSLNSCMNLWTSPCCDLFKRYYPFIDWSIPLNYCQWCGTNLCRTDEPYIHGNRFERIIGFT